MSSSGAQPIVGQGEAGKETQTLLKYSLTWLCWGLLLHAMLGSFTYSVSLALTLLFGTSLFTLVALGSTQGKKHKFKLHDIKKSAKVRQLLITYIRFLKREPRLLILAFLDLFKLILSIASLQQAPNLTMWFFIILADGQLIYLI